MQHTPYRNQSFSKLQKIFVESCIELCDPKSLDSYRARVAGPIYILEELYKLVDDWKKAKLKSFETLASCRDETIIILKEDKCINYGRVSKVAFIDILNSLKDQKDNLENNLPRAEYYIYYLLTVNKDYIKSTLESIKSIMSTTYVTAEDENMAACALVSKTGFLITEIINFGFTKGFIIRLLRGIFVFNKGGSFEDCWSAFYGRILSQDKENYSVIFKGYILESLLNDVNILTLKREVMEDEVAKVDVLKGISKFRKFLQAAVNQRFMVKSVAALDHYQALKIAKSELGTMLDLMHLGYCNLKIDLRESALVVNHNSPEKADFQTIHFQANDVFTSNDAIYSNLSIKLVAIESKRFIAQEVVAKIESAIRYLRAGSEAVELEQKFLNYWIGLENIFSTHDINAKTFLRIRTHLSTAHAVSYARRNLHDFHKSLNRMNARQYLPAFNDDLAYLMDVTTYDLVIAQSAEQPFLALRAQTLKDSYFGDSKHCEETIKRHKLNVERHLTRMYKIRNELVHNAATFQKIENITSNLRYYLVFVLNKLIEYFDGCQQKAISDRFIDMNDFFLFQEAVLKSIEEKGYLLEDLLRTPHPVEFIV